MFDRLPSKACLLTLVCVALLFARLGGGHLHLCFDGSEPAASLHITDSGHHADHHDGAAHDDRDVWLIGDALTKSGKLGMDLPLLLGAFWFAALLFAPLRIVPADPPRVGVSWLHFLRPPSRGPPLHTS